MSSGGVDFGLKVDDVADGLEKAKAARAEKKASDGLVADIQDRKKAGNGDVDDEADVRSACCIGFGMTPSW